MDTKLKSIIAGLVILLALLFQGAKTLRDRQMTPASPNADLARLDLEPYARRGQLTDNQSGSRFQQQVRHEQKSAPKLSADMLIKPLNDEAYARKGEIIDLPPAKSPAAQAETKKKKRQIIKDRNGNSYVVQADGTLKKLKKKSKKANKPTAAKDLAEVDKKNSSGASATRSNGVDLSQGTTAVIGTRPDSPTGPQDLLGAEEWKQKLLNQPNYAETTAFIQAHQSGLVPASVFFEIVQLMLSNNNPQFHELAVIALGSVPNYQSFILLSDRAEKEAFGSSLRKKIESYLNVYAQLRFVSILGAVVSGDNSNAAIYFAARTIAKSAEMNLASATPPKDGVQGQAQSGPSAQAVRQFTNLLGALESASTQVTDSIALSEAHRALNLVKSLLDNGQAVAQTDQVQQ